jgi:DNA-binding transcriptional LysR family regulator
MRLFYDVVNSKSITRAAAVLEMPKSTISRKLAQLEQSVGAVLLKKGQRGIAVTDAGMRFYEYCQRIVDDIDEAWLATRQTQSAMLGMLRVSLPVDFGVSWIGKAIADFALAYPGIELEVDVNSGAVNLLETHYDVTIQLGPLQDTNLVCRRLATISRGVYGSPEYLAHRGIPSTVHELGQHDCIVTAQQRADGIWNLCNETTHRFASIKGKIVVNNISVAREMTIGHVGLSMLPNLMCTGDLRSGRLVRVLENWESPSVHATALVLSRKNMPNKVRTFLDFIAKRLEVD